MSLVCHNARSLGLTIAAALVIVGPVPALASRPATSAALVRARPRAEIGAGHSVGGGGRGGGHVLAHHETPPTPPTTQTARSSRDGCLVLRSPHLRATSRVVASRGLRVLRVAPRAHDGRVSVAAALFHDAHAPPSPVTDVAGLLA